MLSPPPPRSQPLVHPHVRGDNQNRYCKFSGFHGSPPRAWGQCQCTGIFIGLGRFTPTCVGTIVWYSFQGIRGTVHPHVRGDNKSRPTNSRTAAGSPPRAWGQCLRLRENRSRRWFTPTCVGTMRCSDLRRIEYAVHPHVRGDNRGSSRRANSYVGSPPRAWGQSVERGYVDLARRFTPTCVGTIYDGVTYRHCLKVHPHVPGDNHQANRSKLCVIGSPPRAWGQFQNFVIRPKFRRFTPTCVGTMTLLRCQTRAGMVHPHVRGDNEPRSRLHKGFFGSPPRAWGQ